MALQASDARPGITGDSLEGVADRGPDLPAASVGRPLPRRLDHECTLTGSLDTELSGWTHSGEIRIIHNGTLVARVYGDVRNALTIEILVPLVPF